MVAVIGPYRSGKSFLLNKLSAQESREAGFAVGHKVESCTKGIWLRTKPVLLPADEQGESLTVLYLDVEGMGATDSTAQKDSTLLSLSILLCSTLLYNSHGTVDETSLNNLALLTEITKKIKQKSHARKCFLKMKLIKDKKR